MPKVMLTDAGIRALKPKAGERIVFFDEALAAEKLGGTLQLRVGQKSKTFSLLYYENGKPKYYRLGRYPRLSLSDARQKCRELLALPGAALEAESLGTFRSVADQYVTRYVQARKLRDEKEIVRCLNRYMLPKWEKKRFVDITRSDISRLLDEIDDRNGTRQADKCLAIIRKMMNWIETRNQSYRSPVVRGMNRQSPTETARSRILSDDEIRRLWASCSGPTGGILKLCLMTGQRLSKVRQMRWEDIDEFGVWHIPTEDREKGNGGALKLPKLALEVILAQPRFHGCPFVFAGPVSHKPIASMGKAKRELDLELGFEAPWRIHDLRRTARSLMARAGVLPHHAERVLGHKQPGVEQIYDRHQYRDEKADALEALCALISSIESSRLLCARNAA